MTWVDDERARRESQWTQLLAAGGPKAVAPALVRDLAIYGGAQGVWVDKDVTANAQALNGIAVGLLHTGRSYADELSEEGVLYHYPATRRPASRDANEAAAMRAAAELRLPVFVITHSLGVRGKRDIYRGFIEGVDDRAGLVLVLFEAEPPAALV
jgi:putative restriction endonuclease